MFRTALIILLCLLAGLARADTFELSDPAADMWKQKDAPAKEQAEQPPQQAPEDGMRCTVDVDNGDCFCIDKQSARRLSMSSQACAALVREALAAAGS